MKNTFIPFSLIILSLTCPPLSEADYMIHLTNGGRLRAYLYRDNGNELQVYVNEGIVGISKNNIRKIEESNGTSNATDEGAKRETTRRSVPEVKPTPEKEITAVEGKEETLDLKAYKNQKDQMTVELDNLLEKQRQATAAGDNKAKEKIKEEIRKISGKIYQLTDEVTKKNKGKLPEGWWNR